MRYGETLLACDLLKKKNAPRFVFDIGIDGICTTAELFSEDAKLVVQNLRGDTGVLLIDGPSALEVIRDVAGVPATTVIDLSFARKGNARDYLGHGWSNAETDLTWTEGYDSFIKLELPAVAGTYALRMSATPFICKPTLTSQVLQVFIDETFVSQFVLRQNYMQFMECMIPGQLLLLSDRPVLRLHHPDAARPSDLTGSNDRRLLALRFKRLAIARIHEETSSETDHTIDKPL